jgi:hypothetical protein
MRLPIPVLMLALIGALTLFSVLAQPRAVRSGAEHVPGAASAVHRGQGMQATEQQPAALTYFHVMDWLAQFMPGSSGKRAAASAAVPSAKAMDSAGRAPSAPVRLCSLHLRGNPSREGRISPASTRPMFVSVSAEN